MSAIGGGADRSDLANDDAALLRAVDLLAHPLAPLALFLFAVAQQLAGHVDSDVSWLITVCEKYLDGARPYIDIVEPNPPASFLSLAPAVLLARFLHAPVEPVLIGMVFVLAMLSLALCAAVLRRDPARDSRDARLLLSVGVWLTMAAPALIFAQREHFALLAILPFLAVLSRSEERHPIPVTLRLAAGAIAAIAVAFKPFFALALAFPALGAAWRAGSPRALLRIETIACAIGAIALLALSATLFPAYVTRILPFNIDVYSASHESTVNLLFFTLAPVYSVVVAALLVAARGLPRSPAAQSALYASAGFFVCFLLQRKGWINHAYPAIALALLAFALFLIDARRNPLRRPISKAARYAALFVFAPAMLAAPAFFGGFEQWTDAEEYPGLMAALEAHAPPHPRLMALAIDCSVAHPATRRLGGVFVGRPCAFFAAAQAESLLRQPGLDDAYRSRLLAYQRADLETFAQDVSRGRPDAIIVQSAPLRDWALKREELSSVLAAFAKTGSAGEVEVWTRRTDRP